MYNGLQDCLFFRCGSILLTKTFGIPNHRPVSTYDRHLSEVLHEITPFQHWLTEICKRWKNNNPQYYIDLSDLKPVCSISEYRPLTNSSNRFCPWPGVPSASKSSPSTQSLLYYMTHSFTITGLRSNSKNPSRFEVWIWFGKNFFFLT